MMYYSYPIETFNRKTQKYLNKLFCEISNKNIIAVDQLIPCCNINRYLNYFEDIKVIVLDRDPRDLYILNKIIWKESVVPCDNVNIFIANFKALRKHLKYEKEDKSRILRIQFEDAIYKYNETISKINEFLNINNLIHEAPKNILILNNQSIILKYLNYIQN